jgi:two-component system response regulator
MEDTAVEIVLAEDNLYDAEMTIRALQKGGVGNHIVHLKDGVEALDYLFSEGQYKDRVNKISPKLVLLDLKMPKINGIEVLQKLKANATTKMTPVIVLTSSKEDPDIKLCYELGANSYIVKPVGFDNFTKAISDLARYWLFLNHPTK